MRLVKVWGGSVSEWLERRSQAEITWASLQKEQRNEPGKGRYLNIDADSALSAPAFIPSPTDDSCEWWIDMSNQMFTQALITLYVRVGIPAPEELSALTYRFPAGDGLPGMTEAVVEMHLEGVAHRMRRVEAVRLDRYQLLHALDTYAEEWVAGSELFGSALRWADIAYEYGEYAAGRVE
ncbi:hypothetical protein [Streptomyces chrestomyceticus]|uniref:hypothetical protein n=1 Tax=Streptomyces chrestomyceticus TaxID=68185 RepID=UPI0033E859C7